jgi:hypothetical protein
MFGVGLAAARQLVEAPLRLVGALAVAGGGAGGALEAALELVGLLGVGGGLTRVALRAILVLLGGGTVLARLAGGRAGSGCEGVLLLLMARQLTGDDLALALHPGALGGATTGQDPGRDGHDDQHYDDDENRDHAAVLPAPARFSPGRWSDGPLAGATIAFADRSRGASYCAIAVQAHAWSMTQLRAS